MLSFNKPSHLVITCSKRLAPFLEQEVIQLGYKIKRSFQTGVELSGTLNDCIRLNMNLRCASQVLYSLKSFACNSPEELYYITGQIQWETIIPKEGYFSVTSTVEHPSINNNLFVNVKIKDAIADRFREKTMARPDSGPELKGTVVHLFWRNETAEIFLDTSGETLAKHGYRKIPGKAPMLESLAAATLMATKWNRTSSFINPMCGSGTLAIEAALLATNRSPGLFRDAYAFQHILGFDEPDFQIQKNSLKTQIKNIPGLKIVATDISEDAIHIAKINAGIAGVGEIIEFTTCDFEDTTVEGNSGVVYLNPEYGERMGEQSELELTYKRIGDFLKKKCRGFTGYIFTGNPELGKKIGLKASRKVEFYNSKIDCRLMEFDLYEGSRK